MERVSPLWLGVGISGTLILFLLVTETLPGKWGAILIAGEFDAFARVSSGPLRDLRIAIVHCLQAGYLPAAVLYVLQTSRRTVFVLSDSLDCTAEECETLAESIRPELSRPRKTCREYWLSGTCSSVLTKPLRKNNSHHHDSIFS